MRNLLSCFLVIFINLVRIVQMISERSERVSWDISTDNPALYHVLPMFDLDSIIEEISQMEHTAEGRRRKRSLRNYRRKAKGTHSRIGSLDTQSEPYSATVRLSNKCTGTLISKRHVLTAAHCVHDRKRWKHKLPLLKVGFLQPSGRFHWIKVRKMFVPEAWKLGSGSGDFAAPQYHDYAVLRLKRPHRRSFFTPHYQSARNYFKSPMMFNGFPGDKGGNTIWYSSCPVKEVIGDLVLSKCRASVGTSGSGVYVTRGNGQYAVTGVVSAQLKVTNRKHTLLFTVTTRLTPSKINKICYWMGAQLVGNSCKEKNVP